MSNTLRISEQSSGATLTVTPSTPIIGAEISGVDLREPLTSDVIDEVRQLLARHKVLFFRDQAIDTAQQLAFARNFGGILLFPGVLDAHPEHPGVQIAGRNAGWHIDATSLVAAPFMSILRAVTTPPVGGDTIWANLAAAYDGLPDALKQTLDGLYVTHGSVEHLRERDTDYPLLSRRVVRTHPETGEKVLFISFMLDPLIVGWSPDKSAALMQKLKEEATRPEYQVRFTWSPGAIAVWDNRAVHHYGVNDYGDFPRRIERVLVVEPTLPLVEQLI